MRSFRSREILSTATNLGLAQDELPELEGLQDFLAPKSIACLGQHYLEQGLADDRLDDEKRIIRDTFKDFADDVVKPLAEEVHRKDLLVPAEILDPLKEMGVFGLSVPERFGGLKPDSTEDSMGMVIVTEELSRGSLGAAGSLITRPEIMARALLEEGTEEQQARWLPQIASDKACAVSVTERLRDRVASVALKATRTDGGWHLNGGKTWCTYAGAAGALLVLARTDPDAKPAHKGLSLFVVEKPPYDGHGFEYEQQWRPYDRPRYTNIGLSRHALLRDVLRRLLCAGRLPDWRQGWRGQRLLLHDARIYGRTPADSRKSLRSDASDL